MTILKAATQEWTLLQNQFDSYEKYSLLIKLAAILFCGLGLSIKLALDTTSWLTLIIGIILGVFWLQDAIWKTFQSRIESRLLKVEIAITDMKSETETENNFIPYQFNSEFLATRAGVLSTLCEYAKQALRPTIAFPHLILMAITTVILFVK